MHSLGAVRAQDTAVLSHAPRDGQPGLVPHGFGEGELGTGRGGAGEKPVSFSRPSPKLYI